MSDTVSSLGLDHANCSFSTNIADILTAGQGRLDYAGFFEFDCPECAARMEATLAEKRAQLEAKAEKVDT